jgi:hypothetical protein
MTWNCGACNDVYFSFEKCFDAGLMQVWRNTETNALRDFFPPCYIPRFILQVIQFMFLCSVISVTPIGTVFCSTVHKFSTDVHIASRVTLYTIVFISVPSRDEILMPDVTSNRQVLAERCISWDGHFVDIHIQVFDMSLKTKSVFPKDKQQHALSTAWTSVNFIIRVFC